MDAHPQTYFLHPKDLTEDSLSHVCGLINAAYLKGEAGMWRDDLPRTYPAEIVQLVNDQQLIVAEQQGAIVGTVSVKPVCRSNAAMFGMLAVAEQHTNKGIGNLLVTAAEHWARKNAMRHMQLELLAPRTWEHPAKEVLARWYSKLGYVPKANRSFHDLYPEPATYLTAPCDFTLWEKELKPELI